VVLGRIDLDPLGQASEHIGKDRHRIVDRERLAARGRLGNIGLVGLQPRRILRGGRGNHHRRAERGHRPLQNCWEFDHHKRLSATCEPTNKSAMDRDQTWKTDVPRLFMAGRRSSYQLWAKD
jgi:hypothetical protein